jgi:hypothetical protein
MSVEKIKTFVIEPDLVHKALGEITKRVESLGASTELTQIVVLIGDLRQAIGNQYNLPDPYALIRTIDAVKDIT